MQRAARPRCSPQERACSEKAGHSFGRPACPHVCPCQRPWRSLISLCWAPPSTLAHAPAPPQHAVGPRLAGGVQGRVPGGPQQAHARRPRLVPLQDGHAHAAVVAGRGQGIPQHGAPPGRRGGAAGQRLAPCTAGDVVTGRIGSWRFCSCSKQQPQGPGTCFLASERGHYIAFLTPPPPVAGHRPSLRWGHLQRQVHQRPFEGRPHGEREGEAKAHPA
jgi:hypothetical protein